MKSFFNFLKRRPLAMASVIVLLILYLMMIFAPFFAPYTPTQTYENNTFHPANVQITLKGMKVREFRAINKATWQYARVSDKECVHNFKFFVKGSPYKLFGFIPCNIHFFGSDSDYPVYLFGADNLGRDLFSRIVYGSRISLTIGFVATAVSLFLAVLFGGISGYFGSVTDWAIMRFAEFFMLIPSLYFILFLRSLLNTKMNSGTSYMIITLILALVGWPGSARTIRGMVHSIKREEFVEDADVEGVPKVVVIFSYIIPQIASLLIVNTALSVPGFIMSETTLSYLGLGINDPAVSWGSLINRDISTLSNLKNFPWLLFPVLFLLIVTLAFNFLGDALRDYFDPNSKGRIKALGIRGKGISSQKNGNLDKQDNKTADGVMLSVRHLKVTFFIYRGSERLPVYAVRDVSFDVKKGEILGIVGESGSGKSVSTLCIPRLLGENAEILGNIFYKENDQTVDLMSLSENQLREYRGKKIAMIFQEPGRSFDPLQNIGNVFFETFRVSDPAITKDEAIKKAEKLLNEVGIPDAKGRLKSFPHQFSGGQLQRIGIALSLAQNCELLIADEPTTALDVTIQSQIISLLLRLKKERNLSIIFISHNIDLVSKISDRICVMYGGKVMECDTAKKITKTPQHPYTKALLSALPEFGKHYTTSRMKSIPGQILDSTKKITGCPFFDRCENSGAGCKNCVGR